MSLVGTHHVRALKSALKKATMLWPAISHRMELRHQTLKLRYWGHRHETDTGNTVIDLDYQSIRSMPASGVYELRLDDTIGGLRNIRVIFLTPPGDWEPTFVTPLKLLWILEAFPKTRNDFSKGDIARFTALRATVKQRFYT